MSTNKIPDQADWWERSTATQRPASSAAVPDFGSFMRQVFPEVRGVAEAGGLGAVATVRAQNATIMRRDYETAFSLLQRASEAFPALLRHCQQLESELRRLRAEASAEVHAANGETQQWQQIALAMKMHIEESEHQVAVLRKRLAAAEARLAADHDLAAAAEQQASLAIGITTLFHDKIIDAFGVGSPAHAALDAVAKGVLQSSEPPTDETR